MRPSSSSSTENLAAADHRALPSREEQAAAFVGPLAEPRPVNIVAAVLVDGELHVNAYQAIAAGPPLFNQPLKRVVTEVGRWVLHPETGAALARLICSTMAPEAAASLSRSIMEEALSRKDQQAAAN